MNSVAIYAPGVGGSKGHSFIYTYELVKILKQYFVISLFITKDEEFFDIFKSLGINVCFSKQKNIQKNNKSYYLKYGKLGRLLYGLNRIKNSYKLLNYFYRINKNCEIFHLFEFEYIALFLFFFWRKRLLNKTILTFHSSDFYWIKGRSILINGYKYIIGKLLTKTLKKSRKVIVHGSVLKVELLKCFNIEEKIIIPIPYGCNNHRVLKDKFEVRERLGLSKDETYGLLFGILRRDKGILEFIKYFKEVETSFKLIIAGSEGDISKIELENLIKKYNIKNVYVHIKYLTDSEMDDYFCASDFVVIPHRKHHVAFSGPLSLAVEYKKPVIASKFAEIGMFVARYHIGRVFDTETYSDFKENIHFLIENFDKFDESLFDKCLSENSWNNMAKEISILY